MEMLSREDCIYCEDVCNHGCWSVLSNSSLQTLTLRNSMEFNNVEWVFQFNEDEPVVLGASTGDAKTFTFTIGNDNNSNLSFHDRKGNQFQIFAREQLKNK